MTPADFPAQEMAAVIDGEALEAAISCAGLTARFGRLRTVFDPSVAMLLAVARYDVTGYAPVVEPFAVQVKTGNKP